MAAGKLTASALLVALAALALAGPAMEGAAEKQPLNVHAIGMFLVFVAMTMGITYWAAQPHPLHGRLLHRGRRHHRASRTASPSPATTCPPRRCSASPR